VGSYNTNFYLSNNSNSLVQTTSHITFAEVDIKNRFMSFGNEDKYVYFIEVNDISKRQIFQINGKVLCGDFWKNG